jgi:hypothetical protein
MMGLWLPAKLTNGLNCVTALVENAGLVGTFLGQKPIRLI